MDGCDVTEAQLQSAVIECARLLGWRVAHFRSALTGKGYRTPVEADGKGFPDLICTRGSRLLVVELKSASGRLAAEQDEWLRAFVEVGATVCVFLPRDWESGTIEAVLRNDRVQEAA